jgi:hypothetical protein
MSETHVCKQCRFALKAPGQSKALFCRRFPPVAVLVGVGQHPITHEPVPMTVGAFPSVQPDWECGEFKQKVTIQ